MFAKSWFYTCSSAAKSVVGHSLANTLRLTFGLAEEIVVGHVKYNILGWSKTTALFKGLELLNS